jgi:hypothetical protein
MAWVSPAPILKRLEIFTNPSPTMIACGEESTVASLLPVVPDGSRVVTSSLDGTAGREHGALPRKTLIRMAAEATPNRAA